MEPSIAFCRNRNGRRLAYMTWGAGPTVFAPPGWVSHLELQWEALHMRDLYARLAASYRLVFYDKLGVGLSERERDDFSLASDLADLEVIVDQLGEERFALFGNSQAGTLAVAYAAAHPERVTHLVLCGTYHQGAKLAPDSVKQSLPALVRASWGLGSHALAALFVPGRATTLILDDLARFQREAASREMAARLLEAMFTIDLTQELPRVRAPTLVIHRRHDRAIASGLGIELASGIPNARLALLEGDIHFPWLGDWRSIAELIEGFIPTSRAAREARPVPSPPQPQRSSERDERTMAPPSPRYDIMQYRVGEEDELASFRIGLAQIGAADDHFAPGPHGLYVLPDERVEAVQRKIRDVVGRAADLGIHVLVFPEMSLDLNHAELEATLLEMARQNDMLLVSGGYHDVATRTNTCKVFGPHGFLWAQRKHIPATLRASGQWIKERIVTSPARTIVVAATKVGRVAIGICRDFLDLEWRVAVKNTEPPVDLVLNPAFTPVTADFEAAHFEARRSLYACSLFCNHAQFGNSSIFSPEKRKRRVHVPPGKEAVVFRDVPLFELRAERRGWLELAQRRFVQSTRTS